MDKKTTEPKAAEPQKFQFEIQRIYVKDVSYEAPNTPHTFKEQWKPDVNLDLHTGSSRLDDDSHEVVLTVTVTVKSQNKKAFIVEIKQAGIFGVKDVDEDRLHHLLGSYCPNILFPYAREAVSDIVTRGGFPQLLLTPINFDALYAQHLEQQKNPTETEH